MRKECSNQGFSCDAVTYDKQTDSFDFYIIENEKWTYFEIWIISVLEFLNTSVSKMPFKFLFSIIVCLGVFLVLFLGFSFHNDSNSLICLPEGWHPDYMLTSYFCFLESFFINLLLYLCPSLFLYKITLGNSKIQTTLFMFYPISGKKCGWKSYYL